MRWSRACRHLALALASAATVAGADGPEGEEDAGSENAAVRALLEGAVARLNRSLVRPEDHRANLGSVMDDCVDVPVFIERAFGRYVERSLDDYDKVMSPREIEALTLTQRGRLARAVRHRLVADLAAWLEATGPDSLYLGDIALDGDRGAAVLLEAGPDGRMIGELKLRHGASGWRARDLAGPDGSLSRAYRKRYKDTIDGRYSVAVLAARLEGRDYLVLEDFSTGPEGSFPQGWGWRPKDNHKPKLYQVRGEGTQRHLAAVDTGSSVILLKHAHWDPIDYPIMTWCWRADMLPPGGDERYTPTNDSVAGWYVIFSQNWLGIPRQIKYVWSTTLPVGTVDRRDMWPPRPYFFVVESGDERLGRWTFEEVDLVASYQRVYGGRPKRRTLGVGLLTDANSTDSRAEALYADLRVWPREAAGHIDDYCDCLEDAQ